MRSVFAIIGLAIGALFGAYIGIHASGHFLQLNTFGSPEDVSAQSHVIMFSMMGIVGLVGAAIGWLFSKFVLKH